MGTAPVRTKVVVVSEWQILREQRVNIQFSLNSFLEKGHLPFSELEASTTDAQTRVHTSGFQNLV